jgi:hypothetical protein
MTTLIGCRCNRSDTFSQAILIARQLPFLILALEQKLTIN